VTWLPFELHPEVPAAGVPVAQYLGISEAQLARTFAHLQERSRELGRTFAGPPLLNNSHAALALTEYARDEHPQQVAALHHALFRSYFVEGRNLADPATLAHACEQAGIDPAPALAAAQSGRYEARLAQTMAEARSYGITGAPTFIVNNRYKIVGAQPYEVLKNALLQIARQG
jgi:predicted DsbA family dithiol-disulfide isomerase